MKKNNIKEISMAKYCFGVDVGGTTVKIGILNLEGEFVDKWEIKTNTEDFGKNILGDICDAMTAKMAELGIGPDDIKGIGIGLPGPVLKDGTVLQCVNLGWGTFNVADALSKMFYNIPVYAANDANVAGLGEAWKGGGKDYKDIVMITLGTGVGGAIIMDGDIVEGYKGAAGEIGHIHVVDGEEELCGCGRKGCLEQYTSATGVVRLAKRYMADETKETKMREYGDYIECHHVFNLAKDGDQGALDVVNTMGKILGEAIGVIATVVNPEAFIIGGGVSKAGQFLLDHIKEHYRESTFAACGDSALHLATLGNDAGMIGAAALVVKRG